MSISNRTKSLASHLLPKLRVEALLVSEFDIDVGSSLTYQYPPDYIRNTKFKQEVTENMIAEFMLPDGAHLREEDWTVFFLNQTPRIETQIEEDVEDSHFQTSETTGKSILCTMALPRIDAPNDWKFDTFESKLLLESDRMTLYRKRASQTTMTSDFVWNENFSFTTPGNLFATVTNQSSSTGFRFSSPEDERLFIQHANYLTMIFKQAPKTSEAVDVAKLDLLYGINLVRTQHSSGAKRGAMVKSMAVITKNPYIQVFKPILILTLEKLFPTPSLQLLENLFKALNSIDTASLPNLSIYERMMLRGGNLLMFFPEEKEQVLSAVNGGFCNKLSKSALPDIALAKTTDPKIIFDGTQHNWETRVEFDFVKIPIKVPLEIYPEESGEYSVSHLVNTFHSTNLKPNEPSGIMLILHALISQRRIIFLGYQVPAGEVAKYVLAACSLCSPVLKGFSDRAFPYASLTNLEQLLNISGYIAGVTNPAFQQHDQWWDLLCDIPTGKVTVSSKSTGASPYGGVAISGGDGQPLHRTPSISTVSAVSPEEAADKDKEKDLINHDVEFMNEIAKLIQNRTSELKIRQKFSRYVKRFVEVAAFIEYEQTRKVTGKLSKMIGGGAFDRRVSINKDGEPPSPHERRTSRSSVSSQATSTLTIGPKAVFADETQKLKEAAMYSSRAEIWKTTKSYQTYLMEWSLKVRRRTVLARLNALESLTEDDLFVKVDDGRSAKSRFVSYVPSENGSGTSPEDMDVSVLLAKLKLSQNLHFSDVGKIYKNLTKLINDYEQLLEFLSLLPVFDGGLDIVAQGLYHVDIEIRNKTAFLLTTIRETKIGHSFYSQMSYFHELALRRTLSIQEQEAAKMQAIDEAVDTPTDTIEKTAPLQTKEETTTRLKATDDNVQHLIGASNETLASNAEGHSYLSYSTLSSAKSADSVATNYPSLGHGLVKSISNFMSSLSLSDVRRQGKESPAEKTLSAPGLSESKAEAPSPTGSTSSLQRKSPVARLHRPNSRDRLSRTGSRELKDDPRPRSLTELGDLRPRSLTEINSSRLAHSIGERTRPKSVASVHSSDASVMSSDERVATPQTTSQQGSNMSMTFRGTDVGKNIVQFIFSSGDNSATFFTPHVWEEESIEASTYQLNANYSLTNLNLKNYKFGSKFNIGGSMSFSPRASSSNLASSSERKLEEYPAASLSGNLLSPTATTLPRRKLSSSKMSEELGPY